MMKYLVVAAWDEDNVVIAETRAETEERAIELQAIMVSEGHSEAFYADMPSGDIGPFVVDPEALKKGPFSAGLRKVIRDADIGNAELLANTLVVLRRHPRQMLTKQQTLRRRKHGGVQ